MLYHVSPDLRTVVQVTTPELCAIRKSDAGKPVEHNSKADSMFEHMVFLALQ